MNTQILENLGFTKNEIKVYVVLLRLGESKTGPIISQTGLSGSRVYAALDELQKRGMVSHNLKNNIKYFNATDPKILNKNLDEMKSKINGLVNELSNIKKDDEKNFSAVYEGINGFKYAANFLLKKCTEKDEVLTIGFTKLEYKFRTLRNIFLAVDKERNSKKIKMKILLDNSTRGTFGSDRQREQNTKVKYMSKEQVLPSAMNIFKDYVINFVWSDKPVAIIIKNKEIAQSYTNYYNMLWDISKD